MPRQVGGERISIAVRNLGGIDSQELSLERGVVVLTGRNATNRTSLLRAIAGGLGGSMASLKTDAEVGEITIKLDGERYVRRYERVDTSVHTTGDPYTEDDALVDTFSCLVRSNPVRRAVERHDGEDLREVVMRPVDTAHINARIEETRGEIRQLDERIREIDRERDRLPDLEGRRGELGEQLDSVEDDLEAARAAIDTSEAVADTIDAGEGVLDELNDARTELEAVREQLNTQRRSAQALAAEREEVRDELAELTVPQDELASVETDLDRLQRRERELEHTINSLDSIIEFNEALVRGDSTPEPTDDADLESVTTALDPASETLECWTCGTSVNRDDLANQLDDLRKLVSEKRSERADLQKRREERREERDELTELAQQVASLEEQLDSIEQERDDRKGRIEELEQRETDLSDRVDDLEAEAAATEALRDSQLLERHQRLSELEYERGQIEGELSSIDDEIEALEALVDERSQLEARRADACDELESLRTRIEDLERAVVETFNEQMAAIIDRLDYENIDRVWIERRVDEDRNSSGTESRFELHIVRSGDGGAMYEDTIDTLSESERELVGLTVALAGYLAHEVRDTVPVMLLDSLESIDSARIDALVEYFAEFVPYLVVALLPEDAAGLKGDHQRITMDGAAI